VSAADHDHHIFAGFRSPRWANRDERSAAATNAVSRRATSASTFPAAALSVILVAPLVRLIDAEHHGRVAHVGLAGMIKRAFLHGARV
jgi:hypothetical protein